MDPTERGHARWTNQWKATLNAFDITLNDRVSASRRKTTPDRQLPETSSCAENRIDHPWHPQRLMCRRSR